MVKNSKTNDVDFKTTLWKSADKLRNQMDAAEYKHIVLGLIFLKYISDTFDIQKNKIKKMVSDKKSDLFISEDPKVYEKELEDRARPKLWSLSAGLNWGLSQSNNVNNVSKTRLQMDENVLSSFN